MTASQSTDDCDGLIDKLSRERFERFDLALARITQVAATILRVDRVSIWFFSHEFRRLNRVQTYPTLDAGPDRETFSLDVSLRPEYSQKLASDSVFRMADSAHLSARQGDDFSAYLRKLEVHALLDAAIVIDDELAGVLCHEHNQPRAWTDTERDYARRLAEIAATAITVERRRSSTALGQRFRLLVERSVDAIAMASAQGVLEYLNPAARALLGLARDEPLLGQPLTDFLHPSNRERMLRSVFPTARENGSWTGRVRLITRQSELFEATVVFNVYRGGDGEIEYMGCTIRDLSQQIDVERRVAEVHARYEATLAQSGDSLFQIDTCTLSVNAADSQFEHLLGYSPNRQTTLTLYDLSEELPEDVHARVLRTLEDGHLLCGERRLRHADGGWVDVEMSMIRIDTEAGEGVSVRIRDIRELVRRRQETEHLAYYDPLTGLANNNLLRERADAMLAASLSTGRGVGFILLQIDRWQRIFDIQGYQIAESLIRQAGTRVKKAFAGHEVTLARVLGGVEIGILFDAGKETEADLVDIAHAAFSELFRADGDALQMNVRSGSAKAPLHAVNFKDLTKRAGIALRTAHRRRLAHCSYDPTQSSRIHDEHLLEEDLRQAIGTPELMLRYQPIRTAAQEDRWFAVEALLRWNHPKLGALPPSDFIPLAEESRLIIALDWAVLEHAMRAAAAWQGKLADTMLSVNISAITLMNGDLSSLVQDALQTSGLAPERLCLEVTETAIMLDRVRAAERLRVVHALGVCIALDDFGTGYSSLAYLKDLPVDVLKIDRDFVRGIGTDKRDERAIKTVIELGHDLGLTVLAEGVETRAQLDWLVAMDIDFVQGFHIGLPMMNDDLQHTPPALDTWN
ncbi:sensor domain-containing phosphodiesterase [Salinisphaera aquimarina]|uniref:EAL domain-containing protein n=1 Tax=Salinisphaera aquimarina TaxID=2094031 RepID=A0ABV7EUQ2_9GAMM